MNAKLFFCECCQRTFFQGAAEKIMTLLLEEEPMTGSELARKVGVSQAAVSKAVKRLEAESYVKIERNAYAANVKMISIDPDFKRTIKHRELKASPTGKS